MDNRTQFLKGCARTFVLSLLRERPMYGYEIAQALQARSDGIFALGRDALPIAVLARIEKLIRVSREEEAPGVAAVITCYPRAPRCGLKASDAIGSKAM